MRVTRLHIETFILQIAHTRDIEVTCDDCAELSAQLVDAFLSGQVDVERFAHLIYHLQQCIPCGQEFDILQDCARMELQENWLSTDDMWHSILSVDEAQADET